MKKQKAKLLILPKQRLRFRGPGNPAKLLKFPEPQLQFRYVAKKQCNGGDDAA